jgi:uncharacterized membrane protein
MKIKIINGILIIDILTIALVLAIIFIPSSSARIVLALPFLLFFPGYTLIEGLFGGRISRRPTGQDADQEPPDEKQGLTRNSSGSANNLEKLVLGFGLSIAITALIGLGLNYTPWGIRLEPVLYSLTIFILIMSCIALLRRYRSGVHTGLISEFNLRSSGWEGNLLIKTLSIIVVVAIIGAVGVLFYSTSSSNIGEKYTEFYLLGQGGKAKDYPAEFIMKQGQVITVNPGTGVTSSDNGKVIVGITNHEEKETVYSLTVMIEGQPVKILYNGDSNTQVTGIRLQQGEKWEQEVGFAPLHVGDNQIVEFLLFKDGGQAPYQELHLWVNVKEA